MFSKLVFGDFIYKVNISNINCLFFLFSHVKLFDNCAKFFKLIPFFFSIYFCIRKWNHVSRQTKLDRKSRDGRINWHNFTCQFLRKERRVKRRRMDRWRRRSGAREFATLKVELYTTGAERERERESLRKSPREVLREPTMDPLYCYAVAARMPPSRPLSRYADPMRVYTRFLLLFLRSFRPLSSEPSRSPVAVAHLLTRPVIKIDIVRSAIEKEGIKNARNCFQLCFDLSSIISTSPISSYFVILSFCNKGRGKFFFFEGENSCRVSIPTREISTCERRDCYGALRATTFSRTFYTVV